MNAATFLTPEEERSLFAQWLGGDAAARDRMVLAYLPMVRKIANRYARRHPTEDLYQEGVAALMVAMAKWEPARNLRFGTYAMWWVRAAITQCVFQKSTVVKPVMSRESKRCFLKGAMHVELSLDTPAGDGEQSTCVDFLVDTAPLPDEVAELSIDGGRRSDQLAAALSQLDERRRYIIEQRYLADPPATLEELSKQLGRSKERVRQLQEQALRMLRKVCG